MTVYYVVALSKHSGFQRLASGPFSSRQSAERFAIGLAESGQCPDGVRIDAEESDDESEES